MGLITSKCFICGKSGMNMEFETCSNCGKLCDTHLNDAVKKGIFFDSTMKVCPKCGREVKLSAITKLNNSLEQMKSYSESVSEKLEQSKSETEEKLTTKRLAEVKLDCIDGDCINGQGTMIYTDGSKYVGQWKDGKREGEGVCTFSNGTKYVGQWTNNKRHGHGTLYRVGNEPLTGQWTNDKFVEE